jgi:hypothetical protein
MEVRKSLRYGTMANVRNLIDKLSKFRIVFTLSSFGYCAIHWLVVHNFSAYVFSGALVFGAMTATVAAWLSNFGRVGRASRGT